MNNVKEGPTWGNFHLCDYHKAIERPRCRAWWRPPSRSWPHSLAFSTPASDLHNPTSNQDEHRWFWHKIQTQLKSRKCPYSFPHHALSVCSHTQFSLWVVSWLHWLEVVVEIKHLSTFQAPELLFSVEYCHAIWKRHEWSKHWNWWEWN